MKRHDINLPFVDGSGVPSSNKRSNKSHIAIHAGLSSSPKAGPSHTDSQKTVVDGQLITIHSDSDDQVKTSLHMSASSSAKNRRVQRNKQSDENNITLQTLNFLKAAHEERKQLQMQSEANRDKRASERNALLKEFLDVLKK